MRPSFFSEPDVNRALPDGKRVMTDGGWEWFTVESTPTVKEATGPLDERAEIDTREGAVVAEPGDYVIREDDGNLYPISAEKFDEYYRRVETDGGRRHEFRRELPEPPKRSSANYASAMTTVLRDLDDAWTVAPDDEQREVVQSLLSSVRFEVLEHVEDADEGGDDA